MRAWISLDLNFYFPHFEFFYNVGSIKYFIIIDKYLISLSSPFYAEPFTMLFQSALALQKKLPGAWRNYIEKLTAIIVTR